MVELNSYAQNNILSLLFCPFCRLCKKTPLRFHHNHNIQVQSGNHASHLLFLVALPGTSDDNNNNDVGGEEDDAAMQAAAAAAASDPRRIAQDLTSSSRARVLFEQSLLDPSGVSVDEFYREYWEKKPLLVSKPKVFFSDTNIACGAPAAGGSASGGADREEDVQHVVADLKDVWANFSSSCAVRLLCPHLHSDSVHSLLSTLELEFGCSVGSNAYLTPGGDSQGFAPHYDDIDAFILQLEGRKRWNVYPPPNRTETLPRFSSGDYNEKDMEDTQPAIDTVLGPGDVLYMPRGWIHQQAHKPPSNGKSGGSGHFLHLTASTM